MNTTSPTAEEIAQLVAFLPRFRQEGFVPIRSWGGGVESEDGAISMPWPEYDPAVEEFFRLASRACWSDYEYRPEESARMLADEALVASADLSQIKTMLTYCVRGERFCDGHWGAVIEQGHLQRLLDRLAALARNAV